MGRYYRSIVLGLSTFFFVGMLLGLGVADWQRPVAAGEERGLWMGVIRDEYVEVSSELLGAFLVAYEAERGARHRRGLAFTPEVLRQSYETIAFRPTGNGQVEVTFLPGRGMRGGDVTYVVDRKTLNVTDRISGR